jgi:hypothetical protein
MSGIRYYGANPYCGEAPAARRRSLNYGLAAGLALFGAVESGAAE